jgi:hypothetical protein
MSHGAAWLARGADWASLLLRILADVDAGALGLLALDVLTFSAYVFPLCLGVLLRQLPGGLAVLVRLLSLRVPARPVSGSRRLVVQVYCTVCVWNADNAALLFGKLCPSQCAWPMCPVRQDACSGGVIAVPWRAEAAC